MRGSFDRLVDLYNGPTAASPGTLRVAAMPCRIVDDLCFVDATGPFQESIAYLTCDASQPFGYGWTDNLDGTWTVDEGKGDIVRLAGGAIDIWQVVRVESRSWDTGGDYWRAHLAPAVEPVVGCETYFWNGLPIPRTGPMEWTDATADTIITTDGLGHWELLDVADGITYETDGWDGEGTQTFTDQADPENTIEVTCGDA